MFVIVEAYKHLTPKQMSLPVEERIALTLRHAGVSITVTSITDIVAFGIGGTTVSLIEVSKGAMIRNRYNQVPHLTQDTNGKVTNSQLDTTNESQEVSPFLACDHNAHINRHAQRHSKHKTVVASVL